MADTPKHSVSVAGIVVDDQDRVLVIRRRDNGHWEPPGGVLELHEGPEDGVRREVKEETGQDIEIVRLSGVYKNMLQNVVSLVFLCHPRNGKNTTTSLETLEVEWIDREAARARMQESYSVRVTDALDEVATQVRVHDGTRLLH